MNKKVVITGPTGAVGMALIQKCIQEGAEVLAICHKGSSRNSQLPKHPLLKVVETELDELDKIDGLRDKGYNIFYHLAWTGTFGNSRNDMKQQLANIHYTLDAVELAERLGCDTFIGVGSQAEYGRVEGALRPDTPVHPENGYGMAKLCAGQMSRALCEQKGMRHVWVRILSVYGPYDRKETMVSSCLRKMLHQEYTAFTPGEQLWDFLYSEDAADALWKLGKSGKAGRVYCLGSGKATHLKEYILKMKELTDYHGNPNFGAIPYASNQVMELVADISALTADTGFVPDTDFATGIRKTIEWITDNENN